MKTNNDSAITQNEQDNIYKYMAVFTAGGKLI